jgi:hypothetical protein
VAAAAAKATVQDVTEENGKEEESWTGWAKEKITEGLGLKHHHPDVDEEEAARKAGHAAKTARESTQHAASGKKSNRRRRRRHTIFRIEAELAAVPVLTADDARRRV